MLVVNTTQAQKLDMNLTNYEGLFELEEFVAYDV